MFSCIVEDAFSLKSVGRNMLVCKTYEGVAEVSNMLGDGDDLFEITGISVRNGVLSLEVEGERFIPSELRNRSFETVWMASLV